MTVPKTKARRLVEFNLAGGGKEAYPLFKSASLPINMKRALLELLREFKMFLCGHTLRCPDMIYTWSCTDSILEKEPGQSNKP